jgi:hypothetical protein
VRPYRDLPLSHGFHSNTVIEEKIRFGITGRVWIRKERDAVELHSEQESYRCVLDFRTPDGEAASVIVMRRHSTVWLTFHGALRTTVVMDGPQAGNLIDAVSCASGSSR